MNINDIKVAPRFIKGILGRSGREYELAFVQDSDGRWYIDIPWSGDRSNLEMVCGSDDLLTLIAKGDNRVVLQVIVDTLGGSPPADFAKLTRYKSSLAGGAWYHVVNISFTKDIWICPVTLCVLGRYPQRIYFRRIS